MIHLSLTGYKLLSFTKDSASILLMTLINSLSLPTKCSRSLPEIDGLSKETVLTSWLAKFDCIMKGTGELYLLTYLLYGPMLDLKQTVWAVIIV